jgi:hypothetical protein
MEKIFIKVSEETKHKAMELMLKLWYDWVTYTDINSINNLLWFVWMENWEINYFNIESWYDELKKDWYKEVNLNYKKVKEEIKQTEFIEHEWWAVRESKEHKIDYDQIPLNMLKRLAIHYTNWWIKHQEWNWKKWDEQFKIWCKKSAWRHFISRMEWDYEEDHWIAVVRNIFAYEYHLERQSKEVLSNIDNNAELN